MGGMFNFKLKNGWLGHYGVRTFRVLDPCNTKYYKKSLKKYESLHIGATRFNGFNKTSSLKASNK
jgi:hypothetical protein